VRWKGWGNVAPAMVLTLALSGCVWEGVPSEQASTLTAEEIVLPPPPPRALAVGIYNCIDTSGQRRPTGSSQELSTAVPLDCTPFLIESVRSLRPGYLSLVERQHVDELLRERQLATLALNNAAETSKGKNGDPVPVHKLATLRVAEVLLMGQVVAYDRATKEITGGLSINGLGGDHTEVTDLITFSLRAVAVQTGEVLGQTMSTKSVTSVKLDGFDTRVFSTSVLQVELGGAGNEAVGLALREAVRSALVDLIQQGIHTGWWQ